MSISQNPSKLINFSHEWTIENFVHLFNHHQSSFVYSENFSPFQGRLVNSYIELCPSEENEELSLFLCLENETKSKIKLEIKFSVSIIDKDGKDKFYFFKETNKILKNIARWSSNSVIAKTELNNLLSENNKLTINCKIEFTLNSEFINQQIDSILNDSSLLQTSSRFDAQTAVQLVRFDHQWTIDNFSEALPGTALLVSDKIYSPNNHLQFYLDLRWNEDENENKKDLDIYLFLIKSHHGVQVDVQFRVAIVDENGEKCFQMGCRETILRGRGWGWPIISENCFKKHSTKLLPNDQLKLYCEFQIDEDNGLTSLESPIHLSESHYQIDPFLTVIDTFTHKWTIDNFHYILDDEEIGLPLMESGLIKSNIRDQRQCNFALRLMALKSDKQTKDHVWIMLCLIDAELDCVMASYEMAIYDSNYKMKGGVKDVNFKFDKVDQKWGMKAFLMLPKAEAEQLGEKIFVVVKIRIHGESKIFTNHSQRTNITKSNFNAKPIILDSFSHQWTIDNINLLLQDRTKSINSPSIQSKNCILKFFMKAFPSKKPSTDSVSVSFNLEVCKNVQSLIRVKLSIRTEDGQLCNTRDGFKKFFGTAQLVDEILFDKFISVDDPILSNGQIVRIFCECEMIEYETPYLNEKSDQTNLCWSDEKIRVSKFSHLWKIENLSALLKEDEQQKESVERSELFSSNFFNPHNQQLQFYVQWKPMRDYFGETADYMSVFLYISKFDAVRTTYYYFGSFFLCP